MLLDRDPTPSLLDNLILSRERARTKLTTARRSHLEFLWICRQKRQQWCSNIWGLHSRWLGARISLVQANPLPKIKLSRNASPELKTLFITIIWTAELVTCCRYLFGNVLKRFHSWFWGFLTTRTQHLLNYQVRTWIRKNWSEYWIPWPQSREIWSFPLLFFTDFIYVLLPLHSVLKATVEAATI